MSQLVKWLGESISSHLVGAYMLESQVAVLDAVLDVVIVDINVLCTLVVALRGNQVNRRLVVAIELDGMGVFAQVANLLQQSSEPSSLFGGVRKANVLSLCCRGSNETLLTRFVVDSASC